MNNELRAWLAMLPVQFEDFLDAPAPIYSAGSAMAAMPAAPRLVKPPAKTAHFSEGIRCFLLRKEQEGIKLRSLAGYRTVAWSMIEFLHADPAIKQFDERFAPAWLNWLRMTPAYNRGRGGYPAQIDAQGVAEFLAGPKPKVWNGGLRGPECVARFRREGGSLLRWLGVAFDIERRGKRRFRRLPPIVPTLEEIAARWQAMLASTAVPAMHSRKIVLMQALLLLWGTRSGEALSAQRDDMDGHYALVEGKTGLRLSYLNSQALGIVTALTANCRRSDSVCGWQYGNSTWHRHVRNCGVDDGKKPQQDLRKRFSSWVNSKDPHVEMLLAGHGGDVVFDFYLATLEKVPGVMEQFALPKIPGFQWPAPVYLYRPADAASWTAADEAAATARRIPHKLYERYRAYVTDQSDSDF